jgi:tetratricopeptide (TPR) repeat protein
MPLYGVALIKELTLSGELNRGIRSMKKTARKSFDLISFSSNCGLGDSLRIRLAGLSLGIVTKQALFDYGSKLVSLAEETRFLRQQNILKEISERLMTLPLPQFQNIGFYYRAFCLKWGGQTEKARALFKEVYERGPASYRAKAMQSFGVTYLDRGDYDSARKLFIEARSLSCRNEYADPLAFLQSQWWLGILQSIDGDHNKSAANFESLRPMVEIVSSKHPSLWFEYQNSLAVEFMEVGRIEEAERASRIALASPFARLYPEWSETARDLEKKTRRASPSVVSLSNCDLRRQNVSQSIPSERPEPHPAAAGGNIIRLQAETRPLPSARRAQQPARILAFRERSGIATSEDLLNDPAYVEKRYQIMVAAAESTDLQLIDEMYAAIIRRTFPGNKPPNSG